MQASIEWNDRYCQLGQFRLHQEFGPGIATASAGYPDFVLMKTRECVEGYLDVLPRLAACDDLLELGIMKGGSCVLFSELLRPKRHMAIDIFEHTTGLKQFGEYAKTQHRDFLPYFGLSQSDGQAIKAVYREHFDAEPEFDLIIDDASHNYSLSLASFNALFRCVRSGGVYALEDWGWAHWPGDFQQEAHPEYKNPALSNLAVYAMLAVTGGNGVISEVIVKPNTVFIVRGPAPIAEDFRIEEITPMRGRSLAPF